MSAPAVHRRSESAGSAREPRYLTLRLGPLSRRIALSHLVTAAILGVVGVVILFTALSLGDTILPLDRVLGAFAPDASRLDHKVVVEWRAPRALAALVFGACLGVSGALFQSLTSNALGSPDIIGLNTGAYSGVLLVITFGGTGYLAYAAGAVVGGLVTAAIIYLLAYSRGLQGFRLIIVGIAVSAMLSSANTWFIVKADLDLALRAAVWGAGTLNGLRWEPLLWAGGVALVVALWLPWLNRRVSGLELGDDTATMLGVRVESSKLALVVIGVTMTALVTAVTGPISFIALAAPQIAQRIRPNGGSLDVLGSALVGMILLAGADLIAQHLIPAASVPVGAVTVCIGGLYLVWLLIREGRRA